MVIYLQKKNTTFHFGLSRIEDYNAKILHA